MAVGETISESHNTSKLYAKLQHTQKVLPNSRILQKYSRIREFKKVYPNREKVFTNRKGKRYSRN